MDDLFIKYKEFQNKQEFEEAFKCDACHHTFWYLETAYVQLNRRARGPRNQPGLLIELLGQKIPLLKDGMPQEEMDLSPETMIEACFGFRIPEITKSVSPHFNSDARVAFCSRIWTVTDRSTQGIRLTYNESSAEYMLITDTRTEPWSRKLQADNALKFQDVINGSVNYWLGYPLRTGKTGESKAYRNFFLVPMGFSHNRAKTDKNMRRVYQKMAEAYFFNEPYVDEDWMQGIIPEGTRQRMIKEAKKSGKHPSELNG